jgi:hypothetical protein
MDLALLLTPFALYVLFLVATRAGVLQRAAWSLQRISLLLIASLLLIVGSFVVLAQFSGAPPGSTYVPAHIENGTFVPGQTR